MSASIAVELHLLCGALVLGAWLGGFYTLLMGLRSAVRHSWLMVGLEDLGYWVFAGFVVFYLLYRENDGVLRLYVIAAVLAARAAAGWLIRAVVNGVYRKVLKKQGRCFTIKT